MAMTYVDALRKLNNTFMIDTEYRQLLADALSKQIRERVIPLKRSSLDLQIVTVYLCPSCRNTVSAGSSHCDKCGQSLDWSCSRGDSK